MPDFSTYEKRQAYRDSHPNVVVDASGASDGAVNTGPSAPAQSSGGGGGGGGQSPPSGTVQTPNGPKTMAQITAELQAAHWDGQGDPVAVYNRTASAAGGPGTTPTTTSAFDPAAFQKQITAALTPFSQQTSGVTAAELAEKKRQFDATLEWTKQMWANQGMPEIQIKQQAQALAQKQFEEDSKIAEANLALAQQKQAAQESQFGISTGLEVAKTAASMGGPADVFQSDDFIRGANAATGGQLPRFLSSLRTGVAMPAFGATSGAAPQPLTLGGTMDRLASGAVPDSHASALSAIGRIAQAGGGALAPQGLEQLNPDEMAAMQSGFKKLGYSMPAFLTQYQQSRIGQGSAQAM